MNIVGWFIVGACCGAVLATVLVGLVACARRGDELAELHDRERQAARLRLVLGDDDGGAA